MESHNWHYDLEEMQACCQGFDGADQGFPGNELVH